MMRRTAAAHPFRWLLRADGLFLAAVVLLIGIGIAFIYSAGRHGPNLATLWQKQIGWAVLGLILCAGAIVSDYRRIGTQALWLYSISLGVLVFTLFFGMKINGARCWLNFFGTPVQPAEFAKLATIAMLARELSRPDLNPERWAVLVRGGVLGAAPFGLIMLQPDLGTAFTLVPVTMAMLFVAGVPARRLALILGLGVLMLPAAWIFLDEYQKERIRVFFDPWRDPLGTGWNKIQSEIAVGAGGLWGKGWLEGTQNTLGFLPRPVAPTDFIYSVIAEERGFAGSVVLLALFTVVLGGGIRAAIGARDKFGQLLAAGVATLLFCHVFVNLAMTIGLLPITGLPLPLVSYGGSFMVAMGLAAGLTQSVFARRRPA
ncbi:MAG: rod shape-determining protein RodA [Lentisphaerae bacterium]|nr:rod shape-determining protein RodA [Lentisphaerota bacterium]